MPRAKQIRLLQLQALRPVKFTNPWEMRITYYLHINIGECLVLYNRNTKLNISLVGLYSLYVNSLTVAH